MDLFITNIPTVTTNITNNITKTEDEVLEYSKQLDSNNIDINIIDSSSDYELHISRLDYDLILSFDITTAKFFEKFTSKKKILWLGDLLYITSFYHYYYYVKNNFIQIIKAPVVSFKIVKQLLEYKKYCQQYDLIIVSSFSSIRRLKHINIKNEIKYLPYPWLVDKSEKFIQKSKFDIPTFLFLGTLNALGSKSAFDFISNKLYKELIKKFGHKMFKILIAGSNEIPEWFKDFEKDKEELEHIGFVDNLDMIMRQCHGAIIPIDVPIGNRSRIVTCFGLKIPVIAHQNTSLGNPLLKHTETCYLTDNAKEFAQYMYDIYKKPHADMINNAYDSYMKSFDPTFAINEFIKEIKYI